MRDLVDVHYPNANRIRVVLDNLSTHTEAALYRTFPAEEARRILRRIEFHFVPKHASWLNMVEVEIGVLKKQCLDRRIPDASALRRETAAWAQRRNQAGAKIKASVLYPGPHIVASNIFTAMRNRPDELQRDKPSELVLTLEMIKEMAAGAGIELKSTEPDEVAEHFFEGIRNDAYYILPSSKDGDARIEARMRSVLERKTPEPPQMF